MKEYAVINGAEMNSWNHQFTCKEQTMQNFIMVKIAFIYMLMEMKRAR